LSAFSSKAPTNKEETLASLEEARPLPDDLALVPQDAFGFVTVRVADLLKTEAARRMQVRLFLAANLVAKLDPRFSRLLTIAPEQMERLSLLRLSPSEEHRLFLILLAAKSPFDREKLSQALVPGAEAVAYHGHEILRSKDNEEPILMFLGDRAFVMGFPQQEERSSQLRKAPFELRIPPPNSELAKNASLEEGRSIAQKAMEQLIDRLSAAKEAGPLLSALEEAAKPDHHVIAGLNPSLIASKNWAKDIPERYQKVRALSDLQSVSLTASLQSSVLPGTFNDSFRLHLDLLFPNEQAAKNGGEAAKAGLDWVGDSLRILQEQSPLVAAFLGLSPEQIEKYQGAIKTAIVQQAGPVVQIDQQVVTDFGMAKAEILGQLKQQSSRSISGNHLSQISQAMYRYQEEHGRLPPAVVFSKDGKTPLYSWRVELLPYLDEGELFAEFHRDEPWDSPHNKSQLAKMPKVYASPELRDGQEPYATYYQAFVGPLAPFEGQKQPKVPESFPRGPDHTILIVEAGEAVPWTRPLDLPYEIKGQLPKLGGLFKDGFHAVMADGSVRFIPRSVSEETLRAAIEPGR
jgi:hypothetical protein